MSMDSTSGSGCLGFSLLELLIGLGVLGTVLAMSIGGNWRLVSDLRKKTAAYQAYQTVVLARDMARQFDSTVLIDTTDNTIQLSRNGTLVTSTTLHYDTTQSRQIGFTASGRTSRSGSLTIGERTISLGIPYGQLSLKPGL